MKFLSVVFGLLGLAAASSESSEDSPVVQLTEANFDKFLEDNEVSLVKFYAPWCGHCKTLAPEYEAAAKELKAAGSIPLAEVDATVEKALAERFEIRGFPTMYIFRKGKHEVFNGGRTKDAIVDHIKKLTGPAVTWVKNRDEALKAGEGVGCRFVGSFTSKTSKEAETFLKVADVSRTKGIFVAYTDSKATNEVVAIHADEDEVTTKVDTDDAKLQAWIDTESVPLLGPIDAETYPLYATRSKNWVWFAGDEEDYKLHGKGLRKVAKNYRSDFNFVWLDIAELKAHAEGSLGMDKFPGVMVIYKDKKYKLLEPLSQKALDKYMSTIVAGKAAPFLKSEPIPETNDEPVKVVVGMEFRKLVLQKDKDVFLKIYAPWCGHCKKLAPIWDELAEKMKGNKQLVIAKFDGTSNEADTDDFAYRGFPTLYYVKAGTDKPIPYDGQRTLEDFISFIKKHSSFPITVADEESKDEL